MTVTVETSAPRLAFLQESLIVGVAARAAEWVSYDAYRVR